MRKVTLGIVAAGITAASGWTWAAQPQAKPDATPAAGGQPAGGQTLSPAIAAAMMLRQRVETVRTRRTVLPVVVVAKDAATYTAAIAMWKPQSYFPVLIDDGSPASRENIGRFVRAFEPKTVMRLDSAKGHFWPEKADEQRDYLPHLAAKTMGFADAAWMKKKCADGEFKPAGIVMASIGDPAWPAALALAAGRGQILMMVPQQLATGIDTAGTISSAEQLSTLAADTAKAWGASADQLGDTIDAVTICMGAPVRVEVRLPSEIRGVAPFVSKSGEYVSTTDIVGRTPVKHERWAWAGQVFGTSASSVYRAMCGLFLQPRSAWIFDTYESGEPWSYFSGAKTAEVLQNAGWKTWNNDQAKRGDRDFRFAAAAVAFNDQKPPLPAGAGVDAGVVMINTMGNAEFFQVKGGTATCYPGDLPLLDAPALTSMVHSWSAQIPGTRTTVAGRMLEHGAYAYVGSVHEPFLAAFVPTPTLAARLMVMPLGAAARHDAGPGATPWRITVLGDPLITLGPPAPRAAAADAIENTVSMSEELKDQVRDRKFEPAMAMLVMLGRDADAARLARALLEQDAASLTPSAALTAIMPAFRRGEFDLAARLALRADKLVDEFPMVKDALWQGIDGQGRPPSADQAAALKLAIRPDSFARDAKEAAAYLNATAGASAGRNLLRSLQSKATPEQRQQLDALLRAMP